jgi:hypothetical protein
MRFHFCPDCGGGVFYEIQLRPGVYSLPIGGFADPTFPPPMDSVFDSLRHPWVQLPASTLRYERDPD